MVVQHLMEDSGHLMITLGTMLRLSKPPQIAKKTYREFWRRVTVTLPCLRE